VISVYLARKTDPNLILKLEEVNGETVLVESHFMEIQVKYAELTLDDICAGDLRLINISSVQTELQAITPNPVTNNVVQIYYSVAIPGDISLEIYNQQGSAVAIPARGYHASGRHSVALVTESFAPGIYMCKFTTPQVVKTQMFTIIR